MEQDGPRIGIAGLGMIGRVHARSARLAGGRLVGVAASTPERSAAAAAEVGAERAYASALELAVAPDVDVLHICTPNHLHASLAVTALEHGKHVVCEKPVAVSHDEALAIEEAAAAADRVVAVPFVYRYHPVLRHAREIVRAGEIGPVHLVHGSYLQDWLLADTDANWRVDAQLGGPSRAFADIGTHWCDAATFVTGQPFTAVAAELRTVNAERPDVTGVATSVATEDTAAVLLRTADGVTGSVVISQVSPGRKNRLWLQVDGAGASVAFDQEQPETLWIGRREASTIQPRDPQHLAPAAARLATVPAGHPQGYLDCFEAFVADAYAAMATGTVPEGLPTIADGVRAAAVTDAVLASAKAGGWATVGAPELPMFNDSMEVSS
ncbi:Inositol 2-dehydrogenase [Baekduia alba]|uniref:Gfo/Idh/MocA family protein n=1 Tax=Baekduia alba TaxID=2997333 RepID=UPI00234264BE|nr:Gfo/Idh/MocA family oxidoreductase [Baekduia alba]WCB95950.1 Inositol 2-dehydrogenase [Baekduia alba]